MSDKMSKQGIFVNCLQLSKTEKQTSNFIMFNSLNFYTDTI